MGDGNVKETRRGLGSTPTRWVKSDPISGQSVNVYPASTSLKSMKLILVAFIILLALMTSAYGQQTAEGWFNKGDSLLNSDKYNDSIKMNSQIAPLTTTAIYIQHGPFTISFDSGRSYSRVNTSGPFRLLGPDSRTWINDYVLNCYDHDDAIATSILIYSFDLPTFDLNREFPIKTVYTDLISQGVDSNTIYTVPRTISRRPGVFGWGYSTKSKTQTYEISWYISKKSVGHVFSYNEEEAKKIVNSIAILEDAPVVEKHKLDVGPREDPVVQSEAPGWFQEAMKKSIQDYRRDQNMTDGVPEWMQEAAKRATEDLVVFDA